VRIAIAGSGIIGLLTAVRCVSAGHQVVLVEQAGIPFRGAASFDRHRVLRALHLGDPAATAAAVAAHRQWTGLEQLLSARFYEQVGALTVLPPDRLPAARTLLAEAGSRARVLRPGELASRYPQLRFRAGAGAILESAAGVLLADRLLAHCADWLRRHPRAELRPHCRAVSVDADRVALRLADGELLSADAALLAIGPWSRELLAPELAGELVLRRQSMLYCEVPQAAAAPWPATPPVLSLGADGGAWLVPPVAGTPLKLSAASACRVVQQVGGNATPPCWRDHLVAAFVPLISGFGADWLTGTRDCYYLARASAGGPMVAVLADRVVSYAACGGSSFKFAPLIARSLAERLTSPPPIACPIPAKPPNPRQATAKPPPTPRQATAKPPPSRRPTPATSRPSPRQAAAQPPRRHGQAPGKPPPNPRQAAL
jgi:glycine/D-amino acid oxidase-like deaminating enzyme